MEVYIWQAIGDADPPNSGPDTGTVIYHSVLLPGTLADIDGETCQLTVPSLGIALTAGSYYIAIAPVYDDLVCLFYQWQTIATYYQSGYSTTRAATSATALCQSRTQR